MSHPAGEQHPVPPSAVEIFDEQLGGATSTASFALVIRANGLFSCAIVAKVQ
jgi:hypothetical protein